MRGKTAKGGAAAEWGWGPTQRATTEGDGAPGVWSVLGSRWGAAAKKKKKKPGAALGPGWRVGFRVGVGADGGPGAAAASAARAARAARAAGRWGETPPRGVLGARPPTNKYQKQHKKMNREKKHLFKHQ